MTRLLIAGLARSGTTWLGEALSGAEGTSYVDEPDNHYRSPFAFRAKAALPGRAYPILGPADPTPASAYATLWEWAFGLDRAAAGSATARARRATATALHRGVLPSRLRRGPALTRRAYADGVRPPLRFAAAARLALPEAPDPGARDVVVKSVYAACSLEWLAARLPVRVLVLRRDLHGVVASWKAAGWLSDPDEDFLDELGDSGGRLLAERCGAPPQARGLSAVGRLAWLLCCLAAELRAAVARHSDWTVASYEELVEDAQRLLPELAARLGIGWTDAADDLLRGSLAPLPAPPRGGDPRLTAAEAEEIAAVLEGFDLRGWAW